MPTNAIDLCTVAQVKQYIFTGTTSALDDALIQDLITGVSQYWLSRTSRDTLSQVLSYDETVDGNGRDMMMTRGFPLVSVTSVTVDGVPVPQSVNRSPGWIINQWKDAIILLGGRALFWAGRMNVELVYQAGYNGVPYDVQSAAVKHVAVNYKRRSTTDQQSIILPSNGGTTQFRSWEVPPEVERVINSYSRGTP